MKKTVLAIFCSLNLFVFASAQQTNSSNLSEQERQNKQLQLEKSKPASSTSINLEQLKNSPGVVHIHERRLEAMTAEDKKYILQHPEKFIIVK